MNVGTETDSDLVTRIVNREIEAFEAFYDRHSTPAYSLAMRVTGRQPAAEEVTQDAFVTLWRSARRYDSSRGTPKNWLLSIVHNRGIDWLRREVRHDRNVAFDEVLAERLEAPERTDDEVAAREDTRQTRHLITGLPREQRQVIELAYFKGLSHVEIAAKVGIPLGTVKGRQRLALTKLRRELSNRHALALSR
jgi:RNA polymerase sigma-70 factor, ECF subfamily